MPDVRYLNRIIMKRSGKNILLLTVTVILVFVYAWIRSGDPESVDIYHLDGNYYLHKTDYFSKYSIVQKSEGDYHLVAANVVGISAQGPPFIIQIRAGKEIQYLRLATESSDTSTLLSTVGEDIAWQKPWQYVESKTIRNPRKLMGEVVLIAIILLFFWLVMRVFRLKRLTRQDIG